MYMIISHYDHMIKPRHFTNMNMLVSLLNSEEVSRNLHFAETHKLHCRIFSEGAPFEITLNLGKYLTRKAGMGMGMHLCY